MSEQRTIVQVIPAVFGQWSIWSSTTGAGRPDGKDLWVEPVRYLALVDVVCDDPFDSSRHREVLALVDAGPGQLDLWDTVESVVTVAYADTATAALAAFKLAGWTSDPPGKTHLQLLKEAEARGEVPNEAHPLFKQ